jgi:hypothetical protein
LVRGRSKNDVRDAFRLASCLWGGMFGLVVDPAGDGREVDTAIGRFRADVLHAVTETGASRALVERNRHLAWPLVGDGIVRGDQPDEPGLLDLSSALRLRARTEPSTTAVLPVWDEGDELSLVYAATFGDLIHPSLGTMQLAAFVRATGAEETAAVDVAAAFDHYEVPLDATLSGLRWMNPRFALRDVPGAFVGSATALADIRSYWNTRAIGAEVVFWDSRDPDGGPFRPVIEERIRAAVAGQQDVPDNFRIFPCYLAVRTRSSRALLPAALRALIEDAGLLPTITTVARDTGIAAWIHRGIRTLPAVHAESVVAHTEDRGEEQSRVRIELPRTALLERDSLTRQELAVQIGTYVDSGYRGTLKLPYLPDLNGWYRWHIAGSLEHFRVQEDSFTLITSTLGPTIEVTPLRHLQLLEKLFERAGLSATRSLPGEAAWHLLSQFGGYGGLRVLRLPGVRKLLSSTAARTGIKRKAARDRIHDGGHFNTADRIWIGGDQLNAAQVWEFLLRRGIFLPGIETKCPWCQHSSFYRPRDVEDGLQCPKCGRQFPLGPALVGDPVRFRMSGLLEPRPEEARGAGDTEDERGHQPAAVPVLLTLLFLSEWTDGGELFDTSHGLSGDGIEECETDFVVVTYGARPEQHTQILIGECKGRGRVTEEDVRKMKAVATRLKESGGVECDLLFSTTRDAFTEDEMELFRRYHETSSDLDVLRRAPILLTANELDFHRYAEQSRIRSDVELGSTAISGLVKWSTSRVASLDAAG